MHCNSVMVYPQIIVTGDSIAQLSFQAGGYGSHLCDLYNGKVDVVNRGMGGYNSRQLLTKFQQGFVSSDSSTRLFIIHIGTNDSAIQAIQTVPVESYASNLRKIVTLIRSEYPVAKCILVTPSIVDPKTAGAWEAKLDIPAALCSLRLPEHTLQYVKACIEIGHQMNVPVIDCFAAHTEALQGGVKLEDLFSDGVHYSPAGYDLINRLLLAAIETSCPELNPVTLPYGFESFWEYDVLPNSSAAKAAPEFEQIRTRAIALLSTKTVAEDGRHESASKYVQVS